MYPTGVSEWRHVHEMGGLDLKLDGCFIGFSRPRLQMDPGAGEVDWGSDPMIEVGLSRPPSASSMWQPR